MELDLKDLEVSVNEDKNSKVFMQYGTDDSNRYHDNIVRVVVKRNWRNQKRKLLQNRENQMTFYQDINK